MSTDQHQLRLPESLDVRGDELFVDRRHPFFFDHPLDHVSGMLLLTALLERVRRCTDDVDTRTWIDLEFFRLCELDRPVTVLAARADDGFTVAATQDDSAVCSGVITLRPDDQPTPPARHDDCPVVPIDAGLVHRKDPRNVLIGEPTRSADHLRAPLLSPPPSHFLRRADAGRYSVEEIVEAGRQLLTVAGYRVHGRPAGTQLVWMSLTADLPTTPSRATPLALRWPVGPPRGNRVVFDIDVVVRGSANPIGRLSYVVRFCTSAAYRRLREQGRSR
ncbi:MAG TPA: AfsA-related hotdog domain-containing protein [Pseudonocardiaceae bacterium]|nr:AfsA-related hotdog domain-containing protein [Pseudonocardiaceae bacterium]